MKQPDPKPGAEEVAIHARNEFNRRHHQRTVVGIATYGTTLQTFNGRDAIDDLDDELADAVNYAMQTRLERSAMLDALALMRSWVMYHDEGLLTTIPQHIHDMINAHEAKKGITAE